MASSSGVASAAVPDPGPGVCALRSQARGDMSSHPLAEGVGRTLSTPRAAAAAWRRGAAKASAAAPKRFTPPRRGPRARTASDTGALMRVAGGCLRAGTAASLGGDAITAVDPPASGVAGPGVTRTLASSSAARHRTSRISSRVPASSWAAVKCVDRAWAAGTGQASNRATIARVRTLTLGRVPGWPSASASASESAHAGGARSRARAKADANMGSSGAPDRMSSSAPHRAASATAAAVGFPGPARAVTTPPATVVAPSLRASRRPFRLVGTGADGTGASSRSAPSPQASGDTSSVSDMSNGLRLPSSSTLSSSLSTACTATSAAALLAGAASLPLLGCDGGGAGGLGWSAG